ncbi:MAG: hypothetical protein EA383_08315 [Spirochaetaceae bacterium]|nr:MAG: hypothetical protein EA383_08315 [Spirochaetaceae bacterium]
MCTLSWTSSPERAEYELFFNRDELRTRKPARPPELATTDGVRYAAPTDRDRGGSWIGVNQYGVTHCLLNTYEADTVTVAPDEARSRGELVRLVQASRSPEHTGRIIESCPLQRYPPFMIVGLYWNSGRSVCEAVSFHWNGNKLTTREGVQPPVTTSSYLPARVREWRQDAFRRLTRDGTRATSRQLWKFHTLTDRQQPARGVCMSRSDAGTVSCTRVLSREDGAVFMGYFDGPPCRAKEAPSFDRFTDAGLRPTRPLNVAQAFCERAPSVAAKLPRPVFSLLRLVLLEKRINRLVRMASDLTPLEFCERALDYLEISTVVQGRRFLSDMARPVVAANHPTGGIEGLVLMREILLAHGDVAVPANDLLARVPSLAPLVVPVDRYRGNAAVATRYAELYAGDRPVLIFPAGRTARKKAGVLRDFPWAKSFVTHARRHDRRIVPAWVSGENSRQFNTIYAIRHALSIDLNLEMFLLARELFRRRGSEVRVIFNRPVDPGTDDAGSADLHLRADSRRALALQALVESLRRQGGVTYED